MTAGAFRAAMPEFASTETYPDVQVNMYMNLAQQQLSQALWQNLWGYACNLYTAHELVLAQQNQKAAQAGGVPGTNSGGQATSKTVGGGTVQYDAISTTEKDAGYWNLSSYGKQLYRFIRLFGAGCIQL
jgi:hypothetical protein